MAQVDYLLKIDTIDGESKQEGYTGHIDVESWSYGGTNSGSFVAGGGGGTGKVVMQDFHFTLKCGKSSEQLFRALCCKDHIKEAKLVLRKGGGEEKTDEYKTIVFTDCTISSYQEGGNAGNPQPSVQISFNYAKVESQYKEQDNTGKVALAAGSSYDQNTGVGKKIA